ncbi:hypothetical protein DRD23_08465 [Salmonella enterica subsp. enterica serovar Enteritidis]|nr:hypothetical protein [Salmonella enterica subsp. enterica serovar Enteritidis]
MLNITNRTPLASVKLFESSTYPADGIDLYWRDDAPIMFEISDNPDRGQMYQNFLAHIQSSIKPLNVQYFEHQDHSIITAEFLHFKSHFWATVDYDVVTLHRTKPILPEEYEEKPEELSKLHVEVFAMNVEEALLATSFSPVDLAWLLGFWGNNLGFYEAEIWHAACRRLPWITS